jgi:FKBP-type peptidyl-prolyl cis-trans isomerase FklB
MKKIMFSAVAALAIINAEAQKKAMPVSKPVATLTMNPAAFKNALDSFSYAAGMSVAESMQNAGVTKLNTQLVAKAMNDVFNKTKPSLTQEQSGMILQQKLQEFAKKKGDAQKAVCQSFLDQNKKRPGIIALQNGLQYEVVKAGEANGAKPKAIDTVVVNYIGKLMDGTEFDNSVKRGQAATFPLNGVIKGWTEILQLMTKGAHWKVYIPGDLAYGEYPPQGTPIKPNDVLIFDITLEDFKPAQTAATK